MSQERRVINFYRPRIQIPVETMDTSPGQWCLYCLPVDGAQALLRIAPYLKREVTYVGEYLTDKQFKGPTQAELEAITDLVGQLEVALMSECQFDEIIDAIDRNTAAITALQCVCTYLSQSARQVPWSDLIQDLIDSGEVYPGQTMPDKTYTPQQDDRACAIAQLYYAMTYELMTETVLPAAKTTFDNLVPILAGVIAGLIGTPVAGLAMYAIAEVIQELLELGYEVAEQEYINWLLSVKQEWVCTAYESLKAGTSGNAVAGAIDSEIITPASAISFGDKVVTRLFSGGWVMLQAEKAYDNNTQWAQENVDPGYCLDCEEPPDPECLLVDCDPAHWLDTGHPEWLGCENGKPYCAGGYIRWINGTIPVPAGNYTLEVTWTAKGDGAWAQIGIDLFYESDLYQVNVDNSQQLPTGQTITEKWHLYNPRPDGDSFYCQFVQVGWYGVITSWCIRPGHV